MSSSSVNSHFLHKHILVILFSVHFKEIFYCCKEFHYELLQLTSIFCLVSGRFRDLVYHDNFYISYHFHMYNDLQFYLFYVFFYSSYCIRRNLGKILIVLIVLFVFIVLFKSYFPLTNR